MQHGWDFAIGGGAWWIFSTLIRTMPKPKRLQHWSYQWLYRFCQAVAANHDLRR